MTGTTKYLSTKTGLQKRRSYYQLKPATLLAKILSYLRRQLK